MATILRDGHVVADSLQGTQHSSTKMTRQVFEQGLIDEDQVAAAILESDQAAVQSAITIYPPDC
jgi:hypothetical protein